MAGRDLGAFTRYTDLGNPKETPCLFCPSREACNIFGLDSVREANCGPKHKVRTDESYILRDEFGELSGGMALCNLRISLEWVESFERPRAFLARRFYALSVFLSLVLVFGFGFGLVIFCRVIGFILRDGSTNSRYNPHLHLYCGHITNS